VAHETRVGEALTLGTRWLHLAALRWGEGAPRRVLALHGWLDNAATFTGLAPRLPGCDLVAIDLPGHGLSQHRAPGAHYHFVDYVPEVFEAADALGWEHFTLLGHSLGAGVAAFAAAIAPERVERLAMIEGLGPLSGDPLEEPERLATATRQMTRLPNKKPPVYATPDEAVAARRRVDGLGEAAARVLVERALRSIEEGGWTWRSDPRLRFSSPSYLIEPQVQAFLERIRCPALLVNGVDGIVLSRPGIAERMRCIADLEHIVVPGGHHLHLETPEAVAGPLRAFLDTARDG